MHAVINVVKEGGLLRGNPEDRLIPGRFDCDVVLTGELGLFSVGSRSDDFEFSGRWREQEVEEPVVFVDAWIECLVDFCADIEAETVDTACKAD